MSKSSRGIFELLTSPGVQEQARLEMYNSLMTAIYEVGGDPASFREYIIKGMTVIELIDRLGQNGVRFCLEVEEF